MLRRRSELIISCLSHEGCKGFGDFGGSGGAKCKDMGLVFVYLLQSQQALRIWRNSQAPGASIQQSGRILKISGGEAGTTAVYTIDLSRNQVSDTIPDAPGVVRTASSHWDHGKIVTEWKMLRNGEEFMHGTDTHRLGSGEQLIVDRTIESPMHKAEVHLVFDRR